MSDLSLDAFVQTLTPSCTVCALPADVLGQAREGRIVSPKTYTYARISAWLRSLQHDVSEDSLRRHFKNHGGTYDQSR